MLCWITITLFNIVFFDKCIFLLLVSNENNVFKIQQRTVSTALIYYPTQKESNTELTLKYKKANMLTFCFIWLCGISAPKIALVQYGIHKDQNYFSLLCVLLVLFVIPYYLRVIMPLKHQNVIEIRNRQHDEQIEKKFRLLLKSE